MAVMKNGVCVVQCEVALLLSAMRRGSRWTGHARSEEEQDPLIHGLYTLQDALSRTPSLASMEPITFLKPFCDIVQSDDTTGPITGMAITSLDKFLAYGLIDPHHPCAAVGIENLSEAVTHARFVGTNPASDEVVLMKILQVLHTLMLTPVGCLLSNESVCEIMQSCFRICFEMRLSELLRCYAEGTLVDMVQLLFTRLPTFTEDSHSVDDTSSMDQTLTTPQSEPENREQLDAVDEGEEGESHDPEVPTETETESHDQESVESAKEFISSEVFNVSTRHKHGSFTPYGLPCVRELMRFLISIINVRDRHNSEPLIAIGLNLVTVAIECGSVHLCQFPSLAGLVQDGLCRNLLSLLRHNGFTLYSRALRASYLLFERGRQNLKLQLESFMNLLMDIVSADNSRVSYDRKELALECIVQLCHVSHFTSELYVNFDCGLYCSNVFERLTKMLSKNAFPTQGLLSTHLLSLDALLAIVHSLEHDHVQLYKMKRYSETPATLHVSLSTRHKPGSSPTQLNSAGIIFTSTHEQEEEVTSSDEQEVMSSQHAVRSDSEVVLSQEVDSTEVLDTSRQSCDVTLDTNKAPSGYQMAIGMGEGETVRGGGVEVTLPTSKQLLEVRQKKKLILAATEQFNKKPSHGVAFLVEQGILPSPPPPTNLAEFLLQNPALSKAKIGDYIGDRRNTEVLEAFVKNHSLRGVPLVEALRQFLESFRLPGESPIVERTLGVFSQHWLECNHDDIGRVFANADAVHVMSYAILMLNTDLHNNQVKKKMTLEEWIRNQRKTNNGEDFPPEFLTEIYHRIKENEIIMPDEHTGVVKENYKWKVLLNRSASPEGTFLPVSSSEFDQDLFLLVWGPTIAALSYVFDNAEEKSIVQKALQGFSQCASVAARYELREVFDNLIISLCKFTSLLNTHEPPSVMFLSIGLNQKVRHSIQTVFTLAHRHANILREGWKNLLDCLLALFKAKLLPEGLVEVEDFLHPEGKVSLFREETPVRTDSSLLSSLYFYWVSNDQSGKVLTPSEIRARKTALKCVKECHPEQLFSESKFLRQDSLLELTKALIFASRGPEHHQTLGTLFDEDSAVFFLELLVSVALENKDRIGLFWSELSNHLSRIILTSHRHRHLLERAVVGMLRLAIRLMSRESLAPQLLSSLRVLLTLPPPTTPHMKEIHKQVSNGVTELTHSHAGTIKTPHDWSVFFAIVEYTGSGLSQFNTEGQVTMETVTMETGSQEMGVATTAAELDCEERDEEQTDSSTHQLASDWVWISEPEGAQRPSVSLNQFDLLIEEAIPVHEPHAFFKSCETLAYLVRSDPYVTSANFSGCVHSIRTFSEISSSSYAIEYDRIHTTPPPKPGSKRDRTRSPTRITQPLPLSSQKSGSSLTYTTVSLRLLDLLDALYSRVGRIFDAKTIAKLREEIKSLEKRAKTQPKLESDETQHEDHSPSQLDLSSTTTTQGTSTQDKLANSPPLRPYCPEADQDRVSCPGTAVTSSSLLWHMAWCPLLQGMARMCCDVRRSVRQTAITYLQRALLAHGLQSLSAQEWEACFLEVFFPMLSRLLEDIATSDHVGLEETRVRASNLLCKVFLQHLPSLSQLQNFPELWLGILDFMDKFLYLNNSDLLYEAIPESLKNMLLVMSTQGIFDITINSSQSDSSIALSKEVDSARLWSMTWTRIDQFLPGFLKDLFPNVIPPPPPPSSPPPPSPQPSSQLEQDNSTLRQSAQSESIPMASAPISVSQSPTQSPHASPPSSSPVPETQATAEVGAFPVTLHPPLPSLMHPRDPQEAHLPAGQTELDTSQTGLEPSQTVLPDPSRGPPVLLQPTPPYGPTLDSESQSSKIQNTTAQFSTVFSV